MTPASNPGAEASTPTPAIVVSARQTVADYLDRMSRIAVDVEQTRSPSSGPPIVGGYDPREEFEAEAAMYRAVRTRLVECGESCVEMREGGMRLVTLCTQLTEDIDIIYGKWIGSPGPVLPAAEAFYVLLGEA